MGSPATVVLDEDLLDLDSLDRPRAEGGQPLLLDPATIRASRWANRHEASFHGADFEELKAEIADAQGNVQPIKVRPLREPDGLVAWEVVYGHRRHRACLELGLQVQAVVGELDDRGLWIEMERENRGRRELSAWEQGTQYRRALDGGLFASMSALARSIGRQPSQVSRAIAIAELPAPVVAAFASPNDLQFNWADELKRALERDAVRVLEAAEEAKSMRLPAKAVLERLTAVLSEPGVAPCNADAHTSPAPGVAPCNAQQDQPVPLQQERHHAVGAPAPRPPVKTADRVSQAPVLLAEHQGKPVEMNTWRVPAGQGQVYVRPQGSTQWQAVPAAGLRLLGFCGSR
ncbi:ParB/RepB/Spo0J family partition protein [Azohydromonas australica]|uniref:ParB/RepB/Spo0J family partition protein n=1 Tax=Azohydromonas australica TaxID=364039 RepID=UPI0004078342|nr:ParB/RepB/Spo0J family partition protein [Azohydromonas australica]